MTVKFRVRTMYIGECIRGVVLIERRIVLGHSSVVLLVEVSEEAKVTTSFSSEGPMSKR